MELDTDNLPEAEPDDLIEDTEAETEPEDTLDETENPDEEPESSTDDEDEIDYEGQKYKVPKALKDAFLRQADYTAKTMALAEQRKEVEAVAERLSAVSEQETQALSRVAVAEAQLKQYENIDWDTWDQTDPIAANNARWQMTELRRQRDEAVEGYTQTRHQAQLVAQQETARRVQQGQRMLAEKIPGWSQDKAVAILNFGQEVGFSREEMAGIDDPRAIIILNELMELRGARKSAVTKAKVEAQQAIRPAATIKGGKPAIKGLDDRLSPEEWTRRRNAQLAKR